MIHQLTACKRQISATVYVGKGWKSKFICPACQRDTWQSLNFLGNRTVMCNGNKFTKQESRDAHQAEISRLEQINAHLLNALHLIYDGGLTGLNDEEKLQDAKSIARDAIEANAKE